MLRISSLGQRKLTIFILSCVCLLVIAALAINAYISTDLVFHTDSVTSAPLISEIELLESSDLPDGKKKYYAENAADFDLVTIKGTVFSDRSFPVWRIKLKVEPDIPKSNIIQLNQTLYLIDSPAFNHLRSGDHTLCQLRVLVRNDRTRDFLDGYRIKATGRRLIRTKWSEPPRSQ